MEVQEILEKIQKEIVLHQKKIVTGIKIGDVVRQGDLYLHRVLEGHPFGEKTENRQLAPGTTKGSRHRVLEPAKVFIGTTLPEWVTGDGSNFLIGPYIESAEEIVVIHPEHADFYLPAGNYQVTYQMDQRTRRRVLD